VSTQPYDAASVRQLAGVVERIAPRDEARWETRERVPGAGGVPIQVSRERAKQLWALVGMFDRAVERSASVQFPRGAAAELFEGRVLRTFWSLAAAGHLRYREKDFGKPLPVASLRIVRDCLAMLARVVVPDREVVLPVVDQPEPKGTVKAKALTALYRGLVDMAGQGPLERAGTGLTFEDRTRLLAMVSVVLDAAPRAGELVAQRMSDLAPGEAAVGVRRRPQRASTLRAEEVAAAAQVSTGVVWDVMAGRVERVAEATRQRVLAAARDLEPLPEREWYRLREGSQVAVRRWLKVREGLVEALPLTGAKTALWVTLHPARHGPAGLPLTSQGLHAAFERGMTALNLVMAGEHGWSPMPTRLEQLRRSVEPVPLTPQEVRGLGLEP
jgi:hypothetical protein